MRPSPMEIRQRARTKNVLIEQDSLMTLTKWVTLNWWPSMLFIVYWFISVLILLCMHVFFHFLIYWHVSLITSFHSSLSWHLPTITLLLCLLPHPFYDLFDFTISVLLGFLSKVCLFFFVLSLHIFLFSGFRSLNVYFCDAFLSFIFYSIWL